MPPPKDQGESKKFGELPDAYSFVRDPSLDLDLKKALLSVVADEKRRGDEKAQKDREAPFTRRLEERKFWHNTPVVLALVGTMTIAANGIVSYFMASRSAHDALTLKELDARLALQILS